jgi:hypothetical protein
MNQPDLKYGPNTELVKKFLAMVSSSDIDWTVFKSSAKDTAWDASWESAKAAAKADSRASTWVFARAAAWEAALADSWEAVWEAVGDVPWEAVWVDTQEAAWDTARGASVLVVIDLIDQEAVDALSKDIISIIPGAKELFVKMNSNKDAS